MKHTAHVLTALLLVFSLACKNPFAGTSAGEGEIEPHDVQAQMAAQNLETQLEAERLEAERLAAEQLAAEEAARELAEREARIAERERQMEREEALRREEARRRAALEKREREIAMREKELENFEANLAFQAQELERREQASEVPTADDGAPQEPSETTIDSDGDVYSAAATSEPSNELEEETTESTLQPGRVMEVEILEHLSSRSSRVGDEFSARLMSELRAEDGTLVVPAGAEVMGRVTEVTPLKRVGGQASLDVEFTHIAVAPGETIAISASFAELGADKSKDKKKIAGAAIVGAILGRVLGGKGGENAAAGAAVGAAAGTAVLARAKGKDAEIPAGRIVALQLEEVVTVTTRMTGPVEN